MLLVDNDLKRGKIGKNYNISSISEKTFDLIDETTIDRFKVNNNFYIIPRVKGLTNTFQFLYSYKYKDKIKFLEIILIMLFLTPVQYYLLQTLLY